MKNESRVQHSTDKSVGSDGHTLSKKERRALKVQTQQIRDTNTQTVESKSAPNKPKPAPNQNSKPQDLSKSVQSQPESSNGALTEKQLRKLEWEKKLAAQKVESGSKDSKENLSKNELKIKRREQQEAQRLVKAGPSKVQEKPKQDTKTQTSKKSEVTKNVSVGKKSATEKKFNNGVELVQHLYSKNVINNEIFIQNVHPAFAQLGLEYANRTIVGSNARCLSMLTALTTLVDDLQTPPKEEYCRHLESVLNSCVAYLHQCRPLAVSMTNALKQFKLHLNEICRKYPNSADNEKRMKLNDKIQTYIQDDIRKAGTAIKITVNKKINNGDVILIYGCSSLIKEILLEAHKTGTKFKVVVIDGKPHLEGQAMISPLIEGGITCKYALINAVSCIMSSVSKVLLGAHALLTNGYVMSRIGTAQVALVAQAYNKPVLVCCETYKFSERVQTDAFVFNEIGDEDQLTLTPRKDNPLIGWRQNSKLTPLNLLYDVTPPNLVTAVVTELAILPCTSVPVVLRINANETA